MSGKRYKPLTVHDVLPFIGKTKRVGKEFVGECPLCHKKGHLYISEQNGKLLVYCQHCQANGEQIIKALIDMGCHGEEIDDKAPKKEVDRVVHDYRNPDGSLAYEKARCKYNDGSKEFRYIWNNDDDKIIYKKPEGSVNLYNLDRMAKATPNTILYIVEGEKCADAMTKQGFLATTGHCGAKKCIDFTDTDKQMLDKFPVKVVIPDNDAKGEDYIKAWGKCYTLRMQQIWSECPAKGDVADYFEQGGDSTKIKEFEKNFTEFTELTPEKIEKMTDFTDLTAMSVFEEIYRIRTQGYEKDRILGLLEKQAKKAGCLSRFKSTWQSFLRDKAKDSPKYQGNTSHVKGQPIELPTYEWMVDDKGVSRMGIDSNGEPKIDILCHTPLLPIVILHNIEDDTQKVKMAYCIDDRWTSSNFTCSMLATPSKILGLADKGISINGENAKKMTKYCSDIVYRNAGLIPHKQSVSHLGWNALCFVPYSDDVVIDATDDFKPLISSVSSKGTLDEWVEFIRPLRKNIIVRVAIAASFASVLIHPCGCNSFFTHFWGGTGTGKTVLLMVAASVWGNPNTGKLLVSMNMTENNLMTTAEMLGSIPVFGDELQTIKNKGKDYDRLIMQFTEMVNRGRNLDGQRQAHKGTWNNVFISTGEEPITKDESGGGTKNRVIEIECDQKLIEDGNQVANFVREHYGCAAEKFIENLPSNAELQADFKVWQKDAVKRGNTTEKQAMAAALICMGDKLSSEIIFGDTQADPEKIYAFCKTNEDVDQCERAWKYIVDWIAENNGKFNVSYDYDNNYNGVCYGKQTGNTIAIIKSTLCNALNDKGFSFDAVKKDWVKKDRIVKCGTGRYLFKDSIGGIKAYCIHLNLNAGGEND